MERMLEKMASQLNAYDEASLMDLWHKYTEKVQNFEPSKKWEEASIVLCLIQAIRWKNQLFNYHMTSNVAKNETGQNTPASAFLSAVVDKKIPAQEASPVSKKKATILSFPAKQPKNT